MSRVVHGLVFSRGVSSYIRRSRKIRIAGTISAFILSAITLLSVFPIINKKTEAEAMAGATTPSETTLTMTTDSENATLAFNSVSTNGTFASSSDSETAKFGVTTNNYTGYTLSIAGHDDNKQLVDTYTSSTMDSITTAISSDTFNTATYNNKWGIKPSKYNSETNTSFLPAPTTTATTLDATTTTNNESINYTIGLGARVDYNSPYGTYTNTYTLTAVGNPIIYTINYADNSGDSTVTGSPIDPATTTTGSTTDTSVTLTDATPTRTNYTFKSWCLGTVSESGTTCTGTEYNSGADFGLDQTTQNVTTLYAVWKLNTFELTINFAGEGVQSVKVCKTSGDCTGDDLMGTVSATGGSVSNLGYSITYYLYPVFNPNHEFVNWAKTSGEGTLSSTSSTNPTYIIGNGNGAVTVTGKRSAIPFQSATMTNCGENMYDNRGSDAYKRVVYTTAEINGLCWMTRNLDLPGGTTITNEDSNISATSYTLPASSTNGFSNSSTAYVYNSGNTVCGSSSPCYSYYSYAAVTAGTNPSSGNAPSDICPKGWRLPTPAEFTALKNSYPSGTAIVASPFQAIYAGRYNSSSLDYGGSYGFYWASAANGSSYAHRMLFNSSTTSVTNDSSKQDGNAVRCVKGSTMQDFTTTEASSMTEGDTKVLMDSRDGQYYSVAKIGSMVWMTKNLDLAGGTTITSADSNTISNYTLPASSASGFTDDSTAYVYNSGSATCGSSSPCYSYYSYVAATAGTNPSAGESPSDICPKGWRLPTNTEYNMLLETYTTGATLTVAPFYATYAGRYYNNAFTNGGSRGDYWASTANGATAAYDPGILSGSAGVTNSLKRIGFSVRCVKGSTMQDFTSVDINAMAQNATKVLMDSRDNQYYSVAKIGDLVWMTKNLNLAGGTTITNTDSNITASSYTLPSSTDPSSSFSDNATANVYNSNSTTCGSGSPCYSYYSYAAATAGTNPSSGNAPSDICPKGWRLPTSAEYTTLNNTYTTSAALTGSPFLAVHAGYYYNGAFANGGVYTISWSSTATSSSLAYDFRFNNSDSDNSVFNGNKRTGSNVRCVKAPIMQDFTTAEASAMTTETTKTLYDARDGQSYVVAKLADGNIWMLQNLRLGKDTNSLNLTSTLSDVSASGFTLNGKSSNGVFNAYTVDGTPNQNNNSQYYCTDNYGCYYNWYTATASAGTTSVSSDGAIVNYSICPAGWSLPTSGPRGQFQKLYSKYNSPSQMLVNPTSATENVNGASKPGFLLGGARSSSGDLATTYWGYYWSRTAYSSETAYSLTLSASEAYPSDYQVDNEKYLGFAVRCVFKATMQDFTKDEASSMAAGQTKALVDSRDGQSYNITRIGDYYIMTDNLAVGTTGTGVIPAEGSNFTGSDITPNYTTYSYFSSSYSSNKVIQADGTFGAYYNYCLASAGTVCSNAQINATSDICPANWRMPSTNAWNIIRGVSNAASLLQIQKGGYRTTSSSASSTSYGYYWTTNTYTSNNYSYSFYGTPTSLNSTSSRYRYYGLAIRCIYNPTINITVNSGSGINKVNVNGGTASSSVTYAGHPEDQITINATPSSGYGPNYTWTKNSGAGTLTATSTTTESNTFTVGMSDADISVSATSGVAVIIKVSDVGTSNVTSPTISLNGVTCGTTDGCLVTGLTPNTNYTLTATVPTGFTFSSLSTTAGTIESTSSLSTTFKAPSSSSGTAATITLNAPINKYTATIKNASGLSKVSLNGVDCTSTSGCSVPDLVYGQSYTVTATKNSGYDVSNWALNGSGTVTKALNPNVATYVVGTSNSTITPTAKSCNQTYTSNSTTMQSFNPTSLNICSDATGRIVDNRDSKYYTFAGINGRYWMTQNLAIGCSGSGTSRGSGMSSKTLTTSNSNVSTSWTTPTLSLDKNDGTTDCTTSSTSGCSSYDVARMKCDSTYGAWYNYAAASAGTITGTYNSTTATSSICPLGWRIPTFSEEYDLSASTANLVQGGYYNYGSISETNYGRYWSSDAYPAELYLRWFVKWNGSLLPTATGGGRNNGFFLRCVKSY